MFNWKSLYFWNYRENEYFEIEKCATLNVGGLLKKFGLWGSSSAQEEPETPIAPGEQMSVRGKLADQNRQVVDIAHAPYGSRDFCITSDYQDFKST